MFLRESVENKAFCGSVEFCDLMSQSQIFRDFLRKLFIASAERICERKFGLSFHFLYMYAWRFNPTCFCFASLRPELCSRRSLVIKARLGKGKINIQTQHWRRIFRTSLQNPELPVNKSWTVGSSIFFFLFFLVFLTRQSTWRISVWFTTLWDWHGVCIRKRNRQPNSAILRNVRRRRIEAKNISKTPKRGCEN